MLQRLNRTPLYASHKALRAKIIEFAQWEMPVIFEGILEEHNAVRSSAGIFDISHMGRLMVKGEGALPLLQKTITSDISGLPIGRAKYSVMCQADGGILDDLVVYHLDIERYLVVCNAINRVRIFQWMSRWAEGMRRVDLKDITMSTAMIAAQGPKVCSIVESIIGKWASGLSYFNCQETEVFGEQAIVSRTGYTGEDGFEVILRSTDAPSLWERLRTLGAKPCGLGARDTLRLEAGLLLYGNDMDTSTNPYEAGLGRIVHLEKEDFIGKETLLKIKQNGVKRRLAGFQMIGGGVPRSGFPVFSSSQTIGKVASGGFAPTLRNGIGLLYLPIEYAAAGTRIQIDIRGRRVEAQVVEFPFYKRARR